MKVSVETIGNHVATGAGEAVSVLGKVIAGRASGAISTRRIFFITGIAGGSVVKLQASSDNTNWVDWLTGISADQAYIEDNGPLYMRSNCTTYGSGTVKVQVQTFLLDDL